MYRSQWFKDAHELNQARPGVETVFRGGRAVLSLRNAIADDAGQYVCVASNVAGSVESHAQLIVQPVPGGFEPPRFTQALESQLVAKVGKTVRLSASVAANPPATGMLVYSHLLKSEHTESWRTYKL